MLVGAATMVKLVGNFLLISATRSMMEGLSVAEKTGVDVKAVVAMLTQTLFPAPIYQTYGAMIADKQMPFSHSTIPEKDLGLIQGIAREVGFATPIAEVMRSLVWEKSR